MQVQALHDMLPRKTKEENARDDFLVDLKKYLIGPLGRGNKAVYETSAKPAFVKEHNREPENRHEVARVMGDEPFYQMWSALGRAQQELYVDVSAACVERQLPELLDRYHRFADAAKLGSLRLNPDLDIPRYQSEVDIHCVPGGYFAELTDDDIFAGARYDIGSFVFGRGQRGPLNDQRARVGVRYLQETFPDLKPSRILDLGCGAGMNTPPYVDAYPEATVFAVDVSAPLLRYAHARSEAIGKAIHYSQQSAEHTDFDDQSFDIIVSHIMFHETSRQAVYNIIKECHRLLKPGGVTVHLDVPRHLTAKTPFDQFIADWDTLNNNEPFWGTLLFDMDMTKPATEAGFDADSVFEEFVPSGVGNFGYWAYGAVKSKNG